MSKSPWLKHGTSHTYGNPLTPRQMELCGQAMGCGDTQEVQAFETPLRVSDNNIIISNIY